MNIWNIVKNFSILIGILAGIAGINSIFKEKPILEITTISSEKLTNLCQVDGLQAEYNYKGKPITSLIRLDYHLVNSGTQAIKAIGIQKNILVENIHLSLDANFKIIEIKESERNPSIKYAFSQNMITLSFTQWLPNEHLKLIIYVESLKEEEPPQLRADEKEFDNTEIKYYTFFNEKETIYETFPKLFQIIYLYFAGLMYLLFIFTIIFVWIQQFIIHVNYSRWTKENKLSYDTWIESLMKSNNLTEYKEAKDLPAHLWRENKSLNKPKFIHPYIEDIIWGGIIVIILSFFTFSLFKL